MNERSFIYFYLQTLDEQIERDKLFGYSIGIISLWIVNYFLVWMLFEYNDQMKRLRFSRWLHLRLFRQKFFSPIFDEDKLLWLPFVTNLLDRPEDLGKIDARVGLTLKSKMIEFAAESGYQNLTMVNILLGSFWNNSKQDSRHLSPKLSSYLLDSLCPNCSEYLRASQPSISAKHLSQAS